MRSLGKLSALPISRAALRPRYEMTLAVMPDCPLTLSRARCGEKLRVVAICPNCPECVRLRELGFCEAAEVRKVADCGATICLLMGMRVAIGRELASHGDSE